MTFSLEIVPRHLPETLAGSLLVQEARAGIQPREDGRFVVSWLDVDTLAAAALLMLRQLARKSFDRMRTGRALFDHWFNPKGVVRAHTDLAARLQLLGTPIYPREARWPGPRSLPVARRRGGAPMWPVRVVDSPPEDVESLVHLSVLCENEDTPRGERVALAALWLLFGMVVPEDADGVVIQAVADECGVAIDGAEATERLRCAWANGCADRAALVRLLDPAIGEQGLRLVLQPVQCSGCGVKRDARMPFFHQAKCDRAHQDVVVVPGSHRLAVRAAHHVAPIALVRRSSDTGMFARRPKYAIVPWSLLDLSFDRLLQELNQDGCGWTKTTSGDALISTPEEPRDEVLLTRIIQSHVRPIS